MAENSSPKKINTTCASVNAIGCTISSVFRFRFLEYHNSTNLKNGPCRFPIPKYHNKYRICINKKYSLSINAKYKLAFSVTNLAVY